MPSGDWRQIQPVPTTLCGLYFSKNPAVLIMSFPLCLPVSSLSGICLPYSAEGEASILMAQNGVQTSRAAATRFHLKHFRRFFSFQRRTILSLPCGGYKSSAAIITINACSFANSIFGVYFVVILYS